MTKRGITLGVEGKISVRLRKTIDEKAFTILRQYTVHSSFLLLLLLRLESSFFSSYDYTEINNQSVLPLMNYITLYLICSVADYVTRPLNYFCCWQSFSVDLTRTALSSPIFNSIMLWRLTPRAVLVLFMEHRVIKVAHKPWQHESRIEFLTLSLILERKNSAR